MRRMILLASVLACLPMAAHAQSDGRDWDRRGDWMQSGGGDRGDWRGDRERWGRGHAFEESRDARSGWKDQGRRNSHDDEDDSDHHADGGMDMDHHHAMMMRHASRGASFMLRSGDVRLGVRWNLDCCDYNPPPRPLVTKG